MKPIKQLMTLLHNAFFVSVVELVNTSGSIHQFLFTGEERMALGADLNFQIANGRSNLKSITASARNCCYLIFGMGFRFHSDLLIICQSLLL